MDERLQQIFHLRPLQEEAIAYRNNMKLYRTLMKQTCEAELHNLVNVEMKIPCTELKKINPQEIPKIPELCTDLTDKESYLYKWKHCWRR